MAVNQYFLYYDSRFQKLGKIYELLPCAGKTERKRLTLSEVDSNVFHNSENYVLLVKKPTNRNVLILWLQSDKDNLPLSADPA